jgi:outer membrane receptor protein involved in Fe transport
MYFSNENKKMRIPVVIFLAFLLLPLADLFAQQPVDLKGKIECTRTGDPIIFGAVHLKELERWTTTDEQGFFEFKGIRPNTYTLEITCLGYEVRSSAITVEQGKTTEVLLKLIPYSFDMEEVNILAKKNTDIATTTDIGHAAIEHVQPTSLGDIMQLLPGNIAMNPDLSGPQQISIREIGTDNNSAHGTAIIVDGAPVSNDANMQTFSTSRLASGSDNFNTVAAGGVDLRGISTDNIESVEVVKGIPSVVYGNLTSGAVVVKTKAGRTPFEAKVKADPRIKQVAMSKGVKLQRDNSFMNFDLDYLQSYTDLLSKYKGYNRLTGDVSYTKVFLKRSGIPLSFNSKLSYFSTLDDEKTDPDAFVANEEYSSGEDGVRFNFNGQWSLKKKLVSNLKYSFATSYTHQVSREMRYRTTGGNVESISFALEEGENSGMFLPVEQLTELTIDGKPFNVFGQVTADITKLYDNGLMNKFLYGFDFNRNENLGEGQIYDLTNPPFISRSSTRPRAFKDIPAMQNFSVYMEDKAKIPIRSTVLTIQAGARLNNFQSTGLFSSDVGFFLEPRVNVRYEFLNRDNNNFFDLMALSFGVGKTYKSPSLLNLYPDRTYFDLSVLNHPVSRTAIFYTLIYDTDNPYLLPSENTKQEATLDFKAGSIEGTVTAFYENLENGFDYLKDYQFLDYYTYDISGVPEGETPDPSVLPRVDAGYIMSLSIPANNQQSKKMGVEYSIMLGEIDFLYTSFNVDGAWLRTERIYSTEDYQHLPSSSSAEQYKEVGIYRAGESRVSERFNSNLRMVTHVPELRMIVSTSMQMIWYDKYYFPFYDDAPVYLFDKSRVLIPFTDEMREDPAYRRYITVKSDTYYLQEMMSPLWVANIRLSKEITDKMKLSLYVNNFLNYRPMYLYTRSQSYTRRNQSIYFGAEIKIKL